MIYLALVVAIAWIISMGGEFAANLVGFLVGIAFIAAGLGVGLLVLGYIYHCATHS
jgi:hypothetical protein